MERRSKPTQPFERTKEKIMNENINLNTTSNSEIDKREKQCTLYVKKILELYETGQDNAYEVFIGLSKSLGQSGKDYELQEGENDIEYVKRCAKLDFNDVFTQNATYQDVWDKLFLTGTV